MNCPICSVGIDKHLANKCLDTWVAEKVMGWHRSNRDYSQLWWNTPTGIRSWELTSYGAFQPSTDIAAAWEVVERFLDYPDQEIFLMFVNEVSRLGWCAPIHTICLRICHAALKAVGVK